MAAKVGALCYLGLAGTAMYRLAREFTNKRLLAFWAGLAYMISPIFLFNAVHTGHTNFPHVAGSRFWPNMKRLTFPTSLSRSTVISDNRPVLLLDVAVIALSPHLF